MKPTIGFVGLGLLGEPTAKRILEQGWPLVVWNRTAEKAEPLVRLGAKQAATPAEVAGRVEIVISMVLDGAALEPVTLGPAGIAGGLGPGKVHCDMSTIDLGTARRIAAHYGSGDADFLRAPVLGNGHAAAAGKLLIFAGGPARAIDKCAPVFSALGTKLWRWGSAETSSCVKLACNMLIAGMIEPFAESLLLAKRAGVEPRTMLEIVGASALSSPMYTGKGELMARGAFEPTFYMRNMVKDLVLALDAGRQLGVHLPGLAETERLFSTASAQGYSEKDYSAIYEWLDNQTPARAAQAD